MRDQQMVNAKTGEPYASNSSPKTRASSASSCSTSPRSTASASTVTVRTVDEAQYENRLRSWDFDIITYGWGELLSPGNEQRGYWGSQAADQAGSDNIGGIKNPAVDAMIDQVIYAKNRADLEAAVKALDRILLWNYLRRAAMELRLLAQRRAGTASAIPIRCPNSAFRHFRPCGGGTPKSRQDGLAALERCERVAAACPFGFEDDAAFR